MSDFDCVCVCECISVCVCFNVCEFQCLFKCVGVCVSFIECVCAVIYYVMLSTRQCPYIEHSIGRCDTFVVRTKSGLPSFTPYHLIALSLSLSLSSSGVLHIEQ